MFRPSTNFQGNIFILHKDITMACFWQGKAVCTTLYNLWGNVMSEETTMFIFCLLCLYLNYPNMTGAASYLMNYFERKSFYAWTKMRKHVVCCAMTHKHWGIIATFNLVFVMIPWTNVNIHFLWLAHAFKPSVKQKYITLFFFYNVLQKLFEVWSKPKTDQVCTFTLSLSKRILHHGWFQLKYASSVFL